MSSADGKARKKADRKKADRKAREKAAGTKSRAQDGNPGDTAEKERRAKAEKKKKKRDRAEKKARQKRIAQALAVLQARTRSATAGRPAPLGARAAPPGSANPHKAARAKKPKKKCCLSTPRCKNCPLRMLAEGSLPPGYTVHRRRLVRLPTPEHPGTPNHP